MIRYAFLARLRLFPVISTILLAAALGCGGGGGGDSSAGNASDHPVTLVWDANNESEVQGYKLHYGTAPGRYEQSIDVGKVTTYTLQGLPSGSYYFAVTAYTSLNVESPYSNEVHAELR